MRYRVSDKKAVTSLEPPCRKTIYHSKEEAEDIIKHISETRGGREIKSYRCDVCGFWHLTSKI